MIIELQHKPYANEANITKHITYRKRINSRKKEKKTEGEKERMRESSIAFFKPTDNHKHKG